MAQSSGNPFHLEELIRMLIDDGVISTRGPWRIDMGRLDSERVPDTLVGVLQGLPEPGALRLPLRVGEGVAERVTAPLGGAVSVDDTELLRRGVADAEAHAERERVPLPLTVPELQKLREPGAVTDAHAPRRRRR